MGVQILCGGRYGDLVPVGDATGVAAAILSVLDGRSSARSADPEWLEQFCEEPAMGRYLDLLLDGVDGNASPGSETDRQRLADRS